MPEPFKTIYNPELIEGMASHLARVSPDFDRDAFLEHALNDLDALEMMARAEQISCAIDVSFPDDIALKTDAMVASLHVRDDMALSEMAIDDQGIAGWAVAAMARVIARGGLDRPIESLSALREMTKRFSAEFAVRPFFRDHTALALETASDWASDNNVHVRRLASEGARPRLPWGIRLDTFVEDPTPLLPLLTKLRDDPAEYVRRSVSNNLNDIAKDHADLVAGLAKDWLRDADKDRRRLVKHACRTLIKQGHPGALASFGFPAARLADVSLEIPGSVKLGDAIPITFSAKAETDQNLLIDYVIHFMRANGSLSPKVFKWTETKVRQGEELHLEKVHNYKPVTTRKDYEGQQILAVQINGQEVARAIFDFSL